FKAVQFGSAGDIPVAADYDGDRRTDYAVYRPSNGVWYMLQSTKGFGAIQFGNDTDKPVVADYDNDGKADQAVYRAGTWYVMNSSKGLSVAQFGNAADSPVPADYDGDGKTDFAVYRDEKGAGMWYIMQSGGSGVTNAPSAPTLRAFQFGSATDMPIQTP
ncbi:MAG: VCBS repeat-containing protein, partial [Tatlockia sp.]|nr:VCBS repeat-containing protein [Tatlockia sp.]